MNDYGVDDSLLVGADWNPPRPDNAYGAPDMQPSTPTGNGTGYYRDDTQNSAMWGTISQALNYAVQRDQAQFNQAHGYPTTAQGAIVLTPAQQRQAANSRLLLLAGIGVAVYLMVKG